MLLDALYGLHIEAHSHETVVGEGMAFLNRHNEAGKVSLGRKLLAFATSIFYGDDAGGSARARVRRRQLDER